MSKSDPALVIEPMFRPDTPVLPDDLTEWKGVSLLTQKGTWRTRYTFNERLQLCGARLTDLDNFMNLFCPLRPRYIKTRPGEPRGWETAKGRNHQELRLTPEIVLRHLNGPMILTQAPIWVGAKCWNWTTWFAIDLDNQGDEAELEARRVFVEKSLMVLGVPRKQISMHHTPSDGWHYYIFLDRPVQLGAIPAVLAKVGLLEEKGTIEIFPKRKQGFRLPFGYLPDRKFDERYWVFFIRAYMDGIGHRFSWRWLSKRADAAENRVQYGERRARIYSPPGQSAKTRQQSPATKVPVAPSAAAMPEAEHPESPGVQRYRELLQPPNSTAKVAELERMGICCPGTRLTATRKLAWHLVVAKQLSVEEATKRLTEWVYRSGAKTSNDVRRDLSNGTEHVVEQTRATVEWVATLPRTIPDSKCQFSTAEIEGILKTLVVDDSAFNRKLAQVALRFLHFLKKKGTKNVRGWRGAVAVRSVMRRWKYCSGMRYKEMVAHLTSVGLIEMTREKLQSNDGTGRARTYQFHVCTTADLPRHRLGDAIEFMEGRLTELQADSVAMESFRAESDTYREHWIPSKMDDDSPDSPLGSTKSDTEACDAVGASGTRDTESTRSRFSDAVFIADSDHPDDKAFVDDHIAALVAKKMLEPAPFGSGRPSPPRGDSDFCAIEKLAEQYSW